MKLSTRMQSGPVALGLLLRMNVAAAGPVDAANLKGGASVEWMHFPAWHER
jgi:hypothetical protein